jgi:hypothetical protein
MSMNLKEYVVMLGEAGDQYHKVLAENGQSFRGRKPVAEAGLSEWVQINKPRIGECYKNAQKYAIFGNNDLVYCEGYWLWAGGIFPVHHAWLVDSEGHVIDFTAEACDRKHSCKVNHEEDEYFGVTIPEWFIQKQMLESKVWGVISWEWLFRTQEAAVASDGRPARIYA